MTRSPRRVQRISPLPLPGTLTFHGLGFTRRLPNSALTGLRFTPNSHPALSIDFPPSVVPATARFVCLDAAQSEEYCLITVYIYGSSPVVVAIVGFWLFTEQWEMSLE